MNIIVIGDTNNLLECRQKLGDRHSYSHYTSIESARPHLQSGRVLFVFSVDLKKRSYAEFEGLELDVFLNIPKTSLKNLNLSPGSARVYGFNGLPGFFSNTVLEISGAPDLAAGASKVCLELGVDFEFVRDQVGLVTSRIICMIINEAYFTLEEGTASREDIDLAMKLGTNYPFGPFEWASRIGINHVYELLEAVWKETGDVRYRICPLLKKEYVEWGTA